MIYHVFPSKWDKIETLDKWCETREEYGWDKVAITIEKLLVLLMHPHAGVSFYGHSIRK